MGTDQLIGATGINRKRKGLSPVFKGSAATPIAYGKYHLTKVVISIILIDICDIDDENKEKEGIFSRFIDLLSKDEENLKRSP